MVGADGDIGNSFTGESTTSDRARYQPGAGAYGESSEVVVAPAGGGAVR